MWKTLSISVFYCVLVTGFIEARRVGKFWQVTDFHYDSNYSRHGDPQSMCHSRSSGNVRAELGLFGDYLCDAPWTLVQSAVEAMKALEPSPDFILWTGDSVPHINATDYNLQKAVYTIKNVTTFLINQFPTTRFFPVLGNHDAYPSNQMPFNTLSEDMLDNGYYNQILNQSEWRLMLTSEELKLFPTAGYYSSVVKDRNIRMICLNTNLYYKYNLKVKDIPDPGYQLAWMENQLSLARSRNEKVYIVAHIAPGAFELATGEFFFDDKYNKHYMDIIHRYSDIIMGQFYGHEHTDSFRVVYDQTGVAVGQMFLSPAVTPWKKTNNPSVRLYHYDTDTGEVLDIFQYYLDLPQANAAGKADWKLEYQLSKDFQLQDATPASLDSLVSTFKPPSQNFEKYLKFNKVGFIRNPVCNKTCFVTQLCSITRLDIDKYAECIADNGRPTVLTTTPLLSTTDYHHHGKRPFPQFMLYVIGTLVAIVLLLFIIVAILCVGKRSHMSPMRYTRLPTYASGPVN